MSMKKDRIKTFLLSSLLMVTGCSNNSQINPNDADKGLITSASASTATLISSSETVNTSDCSNENDIYSSEEVSCDVSEELDEDELISILEDQEKQIMNEATSGTKKSLKTKLDEYFTLTIGFLFCNQPIKGKTLDELSDTTKAKIISITSNINDVIEEYVPDYKITIKETYTDVKDWTLDKFKKASTYMKEKLETKIGKENYDILIKTYEDTKVKIKDFSSEAWDKTKDIANEGKQKIIEWWKNKTNNAD